MNNNNLSNLVDVVVPLFDPVIQAADNPAVAADLLRRLGYLPQQEIHFFEQLATPLEALATTINTVEQGITDNSITDYLSLFSQLQKPVSDLAKLLGNIQAVIGTDFSEDFLDKTSFLEQFPRRLTDFLVLGFVQRKFPVLHALMLTTGIAEQNLIQGDQAAFGNSYLQQTIHWEKIPSIFNDFTGFIKNYYGWDAGDLDFKKLVQNLHLLGQALGLDTDLTNPSPSSLAAFNGQDVVTEQNALHLDILKFPFLGADNSAIGLELYPVLDTATLEKIQGIGLGFYFNPAGGMQYEISSRLTLSINYSGPSLDAGIVFSKDAPARFVNNIFGSGTGAILSGFAPELDFKDPAGAPILVFEGIFGCSLSFTSWTCKMGVREARDYFIEMAISGGQFILGQGSADGFLAQIFPAKNKPIDFQLSVGYSSLHGIYFSGSTGLVLQLPLQIDAGPFSFEKLTIGINPSGNAIAVPIGADLRANLGPLVLVASNLGVTVNASFPSDGSGNLGPLQLSLGFKPPDGVGLTVDTGGITGGGFLKYDDVNKEYFGALELEFKGMFTLKAFGIINTVMPDGSEGFSMLIIITAEFTPVQLGFGFTLNGVGGLIGINRTVKLDALKAGIKTNTLESILFPQNIVANINRIVSDIKQVFPPQESHYLLCPMGKIGWGTPTLVTLELGLLLELPITGFIILGVLKALLPDQDKPLLKLQVNFVGDIDFENKSISFDASLFDSKILTFTLTGDMALRILYGDTSLFILSVGGFNPAFKEVPADLQNMKRIMISMYDGANAKLTAQSYFAITSNTAQFGAKVELFAGSQGGFNIYGFVSYDVLFQFDPFKFVADLAASVALRDSSSVIMSVSVSGELSGPTPWDAHGEASVSFLFFSVSVPFHVTWGDNNAIGEEEKADILSLLTTEIGNSSNWKAALPENSNIHVSVKKIELPDGTIAIHPFGILTFSERLVPLDITIDKFGNKIPQDANSFQVTCTGTGLAPVVVQELFAPALFLNMSDADKLARPSFEKMDSGFEITGSSQLMAPEDNVEKQVDYLFSYLGDNSKPPHFNLPGSYFKAGVKTGAASQSPLSWQNNRNSVNAPLPVTVIEEQYVIANTSDMKQFSNTQTAGTYAQSVQYYNEIVQQQPELKNKIQVVSSYELNLN